MSIVVFSDTLFTLKDHASGFILLSDLLQSHILNITAKHFAYYVILGHVADGFLQNIMSADFLLFLELYKSIVNTKLALKALKTIFLQFSLFPVRDFCFCLSSQWFEVFWAYF